MNRPPYPARVAAGLLVVTAEQTRKLPTRVLTLPMTAVSRGLQAGMRLQQNIAELAIKGDELLAPLYDKPVDQPSWARFDEDEHAVPARRDVSDAAAARQAAVDSAAAAKRPPAPRPGAVTKAAAAKSAPAASSPAKSAPAESAPAKSTPKAPGTKAPSGKAAAAPAPTATPAPAETGTPATPAAESPALDPSAGRFALYSTAPADIRETAAETPVPHDGPVPDVVVMLDYDILTLAQLRAKVRTVDIADLHELLDYEKTGRNRAPFVTMIENRITAAEKKPGH